MNEVQVSYEGRRYSFAPGRTVRIGRSPENDVVISHPTVSRQHAELAWGSDSWVFQGLGRAGTYLRGGSITRLEIRDAVELSLASPQGPVLRIEPPGPARTQAAARAVAGPDVPGRASHDAASPEAGPAGAGLAGAGLPGMVPPAQGPPVPAGPPVVSPSPAPPAGPPVAAQPLAAPPPVAPPPAAPPGAQSPPAPPPMAAPQAGPNPLAPPVSPAPAGGQPLPQGPAAAWPPAADPAPPWPPGGQRAQPWGQQPWQQGAPVQPPWGPGAPGQAAGGPAQAAQAGPGQAVPGQAVPGQAVPGQAGPGQAGPGQAAAQWGPGGQAPGTPGGQPAGYGPAVPPPSRSRPQGPGSRDELASAFQILVPVKSWLKDPGWRQGLRLLVIPYALLPLVFLALFTSSGNLTTPGWAYSLYVAPLWGIAFWLLIRPPRAFGRPEILIALSIIIWVMLWMSVVTIHVNSHLNPKSFGDAVLVGFNEEITKALPILLAALVLLKAWSKKLDVRMWMFLGTIAGLTFGVREASQYTTLAIEHIAAAALVHSANAAVIGALSFAYRVFVDGFQHAIWAGVAAFFIGMGVNYPRRRWLLIVFGVSIAALLHAVNDWYLSNFGSPWPWILLQAFSLFLFLGYTMSAASIQRRVRRTPLFRGESMLMDRFTETGDFPKSSGDFRKS